MEKDFSCELPNIMRKVQALGTLLINFDSSAGVLEDEEFRGIGLFLWDIHKELETINKGLYGGV